MSLKHGTVLIFRKNVNGFLDFTMVPTGSAGSPKAVGANTFLHFRARENDRKLQDPSHLKGIGIMSLLFPRRDILIYLS